MDDTCPAQQLKKRYLGSAMILFPRLKEQHSLILSVFYGLLACKGTAPPRSQHQLQPPEPPEQTSHNLFVFFEDVKSFSPLILKVSPVRATVSCCTSLALPSLAFWIFSLCPSLLRLYFCSSELYFGDPDLAPSWI